MNKRVLLLAAALLFTFFSRAEALDNKAALRGLSGVKIYFDVNVGNPQGLDVRFNLLNSTYEQLEKEGIIAQVVVGFRGPASRLVTNGNKYIKENEVQIHRKIAGWVDRFKELKFTMEQCAIAADMQKIDHADFLPGINLVANGYVSMVGYQTKGYAVVPMD